MPPEDSLLLDWLLLSDTDQVYFLPFLLVILRGSGRGVLVLVVRGFLPLASVSLVPVVRGSLSPLGSVLLVPVVRGSLSPLASVLLVMLQMAAPVVPPHLAFPLSHPPMA